MTFVDDNKLVVCKSLTVKSPILLLLRIPIMLSVRGIANERRIEITNCMALYKNIKTVSGIKIVSVVAQ